MRDWLLGQQSTREHSFTHAAPGAWAWTPLSGGVPDADDTSGALVALHQLRVRDGRTRAAAAAGVRWLLGVQNRDGGIPTFCRGWGTLPFDRSTPEITAHALRAWSAWHHDVDVPLRGAVTAAAGGALQFLVASQEPEGSWVPLWFGNEHAADEENRVYGTARVLLALDAELIRDDARAGDCRARAVRWLLRAQNDDGGWGGHCGVVSSIEETGIVLAALGRQSPSACEGIGGALSRGVRWITEAVTDRRVSPAPLGLYFAKLWYYEELYPLIFAVEGLSAAVRFAASSGGASRLQM
jgi:squalene-hopene/tetraprenyl-beta-curcumene cyclase